MAFISGFCIMTIEMLGARILSPYFGGSLSVWGSIITIFMVALAMGYLIGGRLSTQNPNAVTFAIFFIGAAVFSLPVILFADAIMEPIFLTIEDPRYGSLFDSIFLFFIPTSILGMIYRILYGSWLRHMNTAGIWQAFCISSPPSAVRLALWEPVFILYCGSK